MEHTLNYKNPPSYSSYKKGAMSRHLAFSLTKEEFANISMKNCVYCGCKGPNGIDRINNTKGYSNENCVPACKHCNYAKGNLSSKDFYTWLKRIINFNKNLLD